MKIWIYVGGRQEGPYTLEELLDKPIDANTKVWFEGLPKWYPAGYLDEMKPLLDGSLAREVAAKKASEEEAAVKHEEPEAEVSDDRETQTAAEEAAEETAEETVEETVIEEVVEEPVSKYAPGRRFNRRNLPDEPCPPTYLGWTIFLTVCCCSPVSLAGLIASICVSSFYTGGNVAKARKASEIACWLVMISFALGIIPVMLMSSFYGN